ncbi:NAD(P)/FAD-dependent oxidoreductase [Haloferacaceae archaeon DSL9]
MSETVVVAGAGVAGLVAARHLAEAGHDVTVYERRADVGGRVRSRREDGFVLDHGFQVLFTSYPAVRDELDLDALDLRTFNPGAVIARPGRRSVLADPLRDPRAGLESLSNPEVPLSDTVRTLLLRRDLGRKSEAAFFEGRDRSIREYLSDWGFSEAYIENFVAPFYGGITLDRSLSTSKRVFEYTFRAMSRGEIAVPATGMGAIPAQLAERAREAGVDIEIGAPVRNISEKRRRAVVETDDAKQKADAVVVATDPKTARRLTGERSIPTEGVGCVTQYYRLPGGAPLDTGKRLLLNAGDESPNTVVPLSSVAPEYAPAGEQLFNATFLGERAQETPARDLRERTRTALASWFPEREFEALELLGTDRIPFAQFAQPPGIHDDLPTPTAPGGRLYLAGDYTEWSSIQGAMESGRKAAAAVLANR